MLLDERRGLLLVMTRFDNGISVVDTRRWREQQHLTLASPEPASVVEGRRFLYDAALSSSHGDSACATCHVDGDLDALAWDLGNPDAAMVPDQNPLNVDLTPPFPAVFHGMKGPLTTQSLRGLANHGPMHWRGDRTGAALGPSVQPNGGGYDEVEAFRQFNVAFPGLLGRASELPTADMAKFGAFALQIMYPPNPIRALDNSLSPLEAQGKDIFMNRITDSFSTCNGCHVLDPDGNLQFAERDEYRYHEALVHPVMAAFAAAGAAPRKVAVLGGGDGMAVREILRYPGVQSVTLVELDPAMTTLFTQNPTLAGLNGHALSSPKVKVINTDAFKWLEETRDSFDVIVVDFPDPTNFNIGKLYTNSFYALLDQRLSSSGYAVIQTTSPLVARQSFWTVVQTIESVGLRATPYHTHVPSFGEWGFVIASRRPYRLPTALPEGLRFMNLQSLPLLFDFPQDMARVPAEVNRLSNQVLVHSYEAEWGRVTH